jgi:hypothetical protein
MFVTVSVTAEIGQDQAKTNYSLDNYTQASNPSCPLRRHHDQSRKFVARNNKDHQAVLEARGRKRRQGTQSRTVQIMI